VRFEVGGGPHKNTAHRNRKREEEKGKRRRMNGEEGNSKTPNESE